MEEENRQDIPRRFTLRKPDKLRHRQLVDSLFAEGKSSYEMPLRMVWRVLSPGELREAFRLEIPEGIGKVQMLVTVPKKKRRRAVDRVLMRRRIREAYRLNRGSLVDLVEACPEIGTLSLAFIYLAEDNAPYDIIEKRMQTLLAKAERRVRRHLAGPEQAKEAEKKPDTATPDEPQEGPMEP